MMMPRPKPGDLLGLVDVDKGIVSREIFVNEEIYRQEQERMFARAWLFVGHESQITRPGDFLVSSMGEESVILCRDRAAKIHVFLNSCRHRGMKVCRYDEATRSSSSARTTAGATRATARWSASPSRRTRTASSSTSRGGD